MENNIDEKSYVDSDIEEIDEVHSNMGTYSNLGNVSNPFKDITSSFDAPNLSTELYNAIPSVFQDETFGMFNRAITSPIIDTADFAIRTADTAIKGFATGVNELKNLYTGENDDRLKRDIYGFFTAGSPAAATRPVNISGRVKQLIDKGDNIEAGKLMYSHVNPVAAMSVKKAPSMAMTQKKSPIRILLDKLPATEKATIPKQTDDFSVAGYHGTATSRGTDKPFFDIKFGRQQDEFLGEGFYFTLEPKIASEYANMRAINQLVDAGKKDGQGLYIYKPTGQKVTTGSLLKGMDIDGKPITAGQQIAKFDLSKLQKPYVVKTLKDRKYLKQNFQKIKDEGYDSVLFADFKDRSKQIMVFPEHIGKVDTGSGAVKQATTSGQRYVPKEEVPPLEIGASKFALDGKLKSNLNKDSIKLFENKAKGATAGSSKANRLIGVSVKDGEKVGIRKNLNSKSLDGEKGILQTIHRDNYNGKALSYQPYATVENVIFNVNQSHRRRIASKAKGLAVPESSAKFNMASVDGNYVSNKNLLRDGYETEIAFNPAQGHLFIDVNTGQAVKGAKTATVIGDRVFANGVTYWKKTDAPKPLDASDGTKLTGEVRYKFKTGGLVKKKGLMSRA